MMCCSSPPSTTVDFDITEWNTPDTLLPMVFVEEVLLVEATLVLDELLDSVGENMPEEGVVGVAGEFGLSSDF